jgi:ankyrin repeat protein
VARLLSGYGHAKAIRVLCELGAAINTPAHDGGTPVHAAAQEGHVEAIRTLCELGADINARDKDGRTPVMMTAAEGHEKVVKLLRKLGADMNKESTFGTPEEIARGQGHTAMAEKLVKYTSQCQFCQKKASVTVKLSACSRCLKTYYCSAACQKQDWKLHKKTRTAAAADQA